MRTLYYLMDKLDTAEAMTATLRSQNIDDDGYYIVSKDADGVRRHHLHDASPLDSTDLIHSGERGALIGGLCGLLFALWIAVMKPMGLEMDLFTFLFVSALIGCFGAWVGGMVGISHENYKLTPFHDAIAQGKYLMVISVREPAKARELKQLMHRRHPEALFEAEDAIGVDVMAGKAEFRPRHL
ncbi:MAG TPA: TIGR04086 family membrane protein [Moraxellaceae bacterium]